MDLGMIGLGRMGANMAERLVRGGHRVVGFDVGEPARVAASANGIEPAATLGQLLEALPAPRVLWLMVPASAVDGTLQQLLPLLAAGDMVVDGGNSYYKDSQRREAEARGRQVEFVDCGTSGGIWGLAAGYCLMLGGEPAAVQRLAALLTTLATDGGEGWAHVGPAGAGHYVKMIHNGIEYGMMQAYAEGFALMQRKHALELDLPRIAQLWRHGSVVRSWLLDLSASALTRNPGLEGIAPYVDDSGEGRWTVAESIDLDVAAPVITLALLERLRSREGDSFIDKLLATMRNEFGGHPFKAGMPGVPAKGTPAAD